MKLIIYFIFIPLVVLVLFLTTRLNQPNIQKEIEQVARDFVTENIFQNPKNTPVPTPTIIPLIPDDGRRGTYIIGQIKHDGPTFKQVIFDPLDLKKNDFLTVSTTFDNETPPQKVYGNLQSDNSSFDLSFSRNVNGIWTSKVQVTDTVFRKYILTIFAENSEQTVKAIVAPRS